MSDIFKDVNTIIATSIASSTNLEGTKERTVTWDTSMYRIKYIDMDKATIYFERINESE